jgi:hypothetical protein
MLYIMLQKQQLPSPPKSSSMSVFYVLMPASWKNSSHYLCRPLLGSSPTNAANLPFVALASGTADGQYQLISRPGLVPSRAQEYLHEAQQQLASQTIEWQISEKGGLIFKRPTMVRAVIAGQTAPTNSPTDDLSSEQILNGAAIERAGEMMKVKELIVVIPKRGWLLVSPGLSGDIQQMLKMSQASGGIFERASTPEAVSPYVYFWADGNITGYYAEQGNGGAITFAEPQESAWGI